MVLTHPFLLPINLIVIYRNKGLLHKHEGSIYLYGNLVLFLSGKNTNV